MAAGSERETPPQQTRDNAARDGDRHRQRTLRARRRIARRHQIAESVEIKAAAIERWSNGRSARVSCAGFGVSPKQSSNLESSIENRVTISAQSAFSFCEIGHAQSQPDRAQETLGAHKPRQNEFRMCYF